MNKKVAIAVVVVVLIGLCALAVVYMPNLAEMMMKIHSIPQH